MEILMTEKTNASPQYFFLIIPNEEPRNIYEENKSYFVIKTDLILICFLY